MIDNALRILLTEHWTVIHRFRYGKHELMEPMVTIDESKQETKQIGMEL